jgi:transcriptional/translational regulatory protein YebC/TACO1
MTGRQLEQDNNRLRVLIETMQCDGRPEREIEKAVRKASDGLHRATSRPVRRLVRFSLPRRAPKHVDLSRW